MIFTVHLNNKFSFEPITTDDISQPIKQLDINKATQQSDEFAQLHASRVFLSYVPYVPYLRALSTPYPYLLNLFRMDLFPMAFIP